METQYGQHEAIAIGSSETGTSRRLRHPCDSRITTKTNNHLCGPTWTYTGGAYLHFRIVWRSKQKRDTDMTSPVQMRFDSIGPHSIGPDVIRQDKAPSDQAGQMKTIANQEAAGSRIYKDDRTATS